MVNWEKKGSHDWQLNAHAHALANSMAGAWADPEVGGANEIPSLPVHPPHRRRALSHFAAPQLPLPLGRPSSPPSLPPQPCPASPSLLAYWPWPPWPSHAACGSAGAPPHPTPSQLRPRCRCTRPARSARWLWLRASSARSPPAAAALRTLRTKRTMRWRLRCMGRRATAPRHGSPPKPAACVSCRMMNCKRGLRP